MDAKQEAHSPNSSLSPPADGGGEGAHGGLKLPKDKKCPFCSQPFTSSSLGRHLDLYIKPRNPKPPDGIHDVEEIKRIRGGITRRQPRTSLKAGANVNSSGWKQNRSSSVEPASSSTTTATTAARGAQPVLAQVENRVTEASPVNSPINVKDGEAMQTSFNTPNWQATGVINNLPPRVPSRASAATPQAHGQAERMQAMRRDGAGNRIERPLGRGEEATMQLQEDAEVGRAAELALREVLSSLEAARRRVEPKQLFEGIDILTLTFPALCLAILPAPPTIFSSTPFPGLESWTIDPPGRMQLDIITRRMYARLLEIRKAANGNEESFPGGLYFQHSAHVESAWEHWQTLSEAERQSAWRIETLRAFTKAQEDKKSVLQQLEAAQTRIRHLEAEFDRLSRCQLPREYLLHPPNTLPTPAAVIKEFENNTRRSKSFSSAVGEMEEADYDPDTLIRKWRATVQATMRKQRGGTTIASTYGFDHERNVSESGGPANVPPKTTMTGHYVLNGAVLGVNGPMPRNSNAPAHDPGFVEYETPPEPGTVLSPEDEEDTAGKRREEEDQDEVATKSALMPRIRMIADERENGVQDIQGMLNGNGNGKRPREAVHGVDDRATKMWKKR